LASDFLEIIRKGVWESEKEGKEGNKIRVGNE
jgi:hypothetical protein